MHIHLQSGTVSASDLSICSPNAAQEFIREVLEDTHGSNHYPISLTDFRITHTCRTPMYNLKNADWKRFGAETHTNEAHEARMIEDAADEFNRCVIRAVIFSILKSSAVAHLKRIPWWTPKYSRVIVERKRALRRCQISRTVADKITYNRSNGNAKLIKNKAHKISRQSYISTINRNTPMSQIWDKIMKINGKYKNNHTPYI